MSKEKTETGRPHSRKHTSSAAHIKANGKSHGKIAGHDRLKDSKTSRHHGKKKASSHLKMWAFGIFIVLAIGAGALALLSKQHVDHLAADQKGQADKGPLVETSVVKLAASTRSLVLEGEARPYFETTLYAKVSGYLKTILVDEGDVVKLGQVLATVDSPETDQAYLSAKADAINKQRIANRYKVLIQKELVAAQEAEQTFAQAKMAQATLQSQAQLKEYEIIRAPFNGVVTERFLDPGDLVGDASNSRSNQLAILTVSNTKKLKVDAYVDQKFASSMKIGQDVSIYLNEDSGHKFSGTIARVGGSLDPRTRMLLVEVDFDNADGRIVSGSFVHIQTQISLPHLFIAPVETLILQNGKTVIAEVLPDSHLKFHEIQIVENDGTNFLVAEGVRENEKLAQNVGVNIKDGDFVRMVDKGDASSGKPQISNQVASQQQGQDQDKPVPEKADESK